MIFVNLLTRYVSGGDLTITPSFLVDFMGNKRTTQMYFISCTRERSQWWNTGVLAL